MGRQDDEIQRKLSELEASMEYDEPAKVLKVTPDENELSRSNDTSLSSDLNIFIGLGLLLTSVFLVFNHVKVGTGWLAWLGWGSQGFGFTIIPLLIGLGIIFYNHKLKVGWLITAASCALIFFAILSQLVMVFPSTSLLGLIIMFLPLAFGLALIMRGMSGKKGN